MPLIALLLLFVQVIQPVPPERVVVTPAEVELMVDATAPLRATAYDAAGAVLPGVAVRWFSTNPDVAAVDSAGQVTALRPGRARIAARMGRSQGFATVTVAPLPPAAVTASLPAVYAGASAPLTVVVRDRQGTVLPEAPLAFLSLDAAVAVVDAAGRVYGQAPGETAVTVRAGEVETHVTVRVVENPAVSYELIAGGPLDVRTGDVLRFRVDARTADGAEVPGFLPAWSVGAAGAQIETDGAEGVFVAEAPGTYLVTALIGEGLARTVPVRVEPRTYDVELVRIGRGPIRHHNAADTWVFEGIDGRDYAYIGTFFYDWMKVFDVTDPEHPVLTDSLQVDARRINDVKIHPNNRLAVITREGASNRKNGIVLLDLSTPAHPTILSEYTDTVTGGVHNVWILGDENLIYAVHNGTRDIHIIDIADPLHPKEVGRWGIERPGKSLHDVIVQDGYAYLSYWDDGLITLDAGAGTHGGTPTRPAFVSQIKYPIGHTHTAWRHGRYVFVGDEIFPPGWKSDAPIEARGYIHVMDVSDLEHPVEVARYEVPEAGAHNVWVEDDKLYIGYYQGGLRVVDISGELRGDLYRQGREMAAFKTTDADAYVPNWPMTFSAQVFKGLIYSADFNSGLWITKLVEKPLVP